MNNYNYPIIMFCTVNYTFFILAELVESGLFLILKFW